MKQLFLYHDLYRLGKKLGSTFFLRDRIYKTAALRPFSDITSCELCCSKIQTYRRIAVRQVMAVNLMRFFTPVTPSRLLDQLHAYIYFTNLLTSLCGHLLRPRPEYHSADSTIKATNVTCPWHSKLTRQICTMNKQSSCLICG